MQTRKCQTRVPNAVAWGLTSSIRKSDDPAFRCEHRARFGKGLVLKNSLWALATLVNLKLNDHVFADFYL